MAEPRTLQDLSEPGVLNDMRHELHLAELSGDTASFAAWARKWGRPTIAHLSPRHDYWNNQQCA